VNISELTVILCLLDVHFIQTTSCSSTRWTLCL